MPRPLAARLRDAERRNTALQKRVNALESFVQMAASEYSGTSIISGLPLDDISKTAVNTARRLDCVATVVPDSSNQGKFTLRAHRKP